MGSTRGSRFPTSRLATLPLATARGSWRTTSTKCRRTSTTCLLPAGTARKAKKAMVDAGRLADELRSEQDHVVAQDKAARTTEVSLTEMQRKAEEASFQMARGAAQIPAKLEARAHEVEMELNRTIQHTDEVHKTITKGERRVKELLFQQEENKKNQDRITDLVDKLQQKIKSYKKQIEEAEEIAAINLAKFRQAQQDFEEAEERSKICEANITKYRSARGASATPGPM